MKIKIQDLPRDRKISLEEMITVIGGSLLMASFPADQGKLGGISEEMSLRLQMTMERRAEVIASLSQIMKKISATSDTIIQNIK